MKRLILILILSLLLVGCSSPASNPEYAEWVESARVAALAIPPPSAFDSATGTPLIYRNNIHVGITRYDRYTGLPVFMIWRRIDGVSGLPSLFFPVSYLCKDLSNHDITFNDFVEGKLQWE